MTKKQETYNAMIETAEKYENPNGHIFFKADHCALCKIYYVEFVYASDECYGCPLASKWSTPGCVHFASYKKAKDASPAFCEHSKSKPPPEFKARAATLRKHAEVIKTWPEPRFTVDGWIYSGKELSRDD